MQTVTFDNFMNIHLIVAEVRAAEPVEGTSKLLKLQLFDGSGDRQIVAGVAQQYEPAELVGKKIVIVANLQPAVIRGVESNGMLLAADLDGKPSILFPKQDILPGTRVR
ncbi:MAG TPA: methionine--tRNA ligase subunit beta [Thermoanaerobaculia bacterium]|nr:methionine--tRNA ligase subunit beta [Thermoanaerobaculia bacterium]HUM30681.1 methionine--tRNA ligase subunit beta [Thermoanaerobaculia bacterium]HXK68911.1 methionine--tRNA ligase subunit beta [Thermoanaerobaculia bacterium]